MLKSTIVILAMFGSVAAQAKGYDYYAFQDQKAVGAATNPLYQAAVQDQKAVSLESQVETAKLLDLNEGF